MEIKKFYWIKLKDSFMNSDAVDFLMGQKNGSDYIVLYQMLCLKTLNSDGKLETKIGEVIVPYDAKKIQRDTRYFNYDTVVVALELYKKLGLIYEDNAGNLQIANYTDFMGSETYWAERKRIQREQKQIGQCPTDVQEFPTKRKILDKDIRNIDIDINNNISSNEDIYVEQSSTNGTPSLESKQKTESKINSDSKQQSDSNSSFKINIVEEFLLIYNNYPCSKNKNKKKSLDLYFKWLTKGKIITLMDKKKRVKYNHLQIKFALKKFIAENEDKEEQFIPRLQTFLGENLICDYISKTKKSYENHMLKKYGEDWMKVKFEYISEV